MQADKEGDSILKQMQVMKKHDMRTSSVIAILTLLICCLLFQKYIFGGEYYIFSDAVSNDTIRASIPTYHMLYDYLKEGWSWWSMRMALGTTMLSHSDVMLDPFTYLLFIFGKSHIDTMVVYMTIAKIICSAVFFNVYLQSFRLVPTARVIASLAYAFNGFNIIMGRNYTFGLVCVYLPLVLLGAEKYLKEKKWKLLLVSIFLTAIYFYYFFYMIAIILVIYVIVRYFQLRTFKWLDFSKTLFQFALIGITAVMLSAFILLPNLAMVLSNARVKGVPFDFANLSNINPQLFFTAFLKLLWVNSLGYPLVTEYIGAIDYFEIALYTSLLAIVVIPQIFYSATKQIKISTMWILLVGTISMSFECFGYLFNMLKTFNFRFTFAINFLLAVGIAIGLDAIFCTRKFSIKIAFFSSLSILALYFYGISGFYTKEGGVSLTHSLEYVKTYKNSLVIIGVVLAFYIFLLLLYSKIERVSIRMISVFIISFLVAELAFNYGPWLNISYSYNSSTQKIGFYDESSDIIRKLQKSNASKDFYRINKDYNSVVTNGLFSNNDAMVQNYFGLEGYNSSNNPYAINFLRNLGVFVCLNLTETEGYSPFDFNGTQFNYINGVGNREILSAYLGVKYYLVKNENTAIPYYYEWKWQDAGIQVYENPYALPLATVSNIYVDFDEFTNCSEQQKEQLLLKAKVIDKAVQQAYNLKVKPVAEVLDETANVTSLLQQTKKLNENQVQVIFSAEDAIKLTVDALEEAAIISLSIPYDAGWSATVNGKVAQPFVSQGGLLSILVPKGESNITLEFFPQGMREGIAISEIAFLAVMIYIGVEKFKRRKNGRIHQKKFQF